MKDYQAAPDLLKDRVILVTGAGDGIGAAAARNFAAHGATVVLLGRTVRKLEQVYDTIEAAEGPQPGIYPMNLEGARFKDYADMAQTLEREFGRLDGLLHNAALAGTRTPAHLYDLEMWIKVMQVNLNASFLMTRACLPILKRSPDASVIFTTAEVGRHGRAYWGAYGISNAAVENMMQIFADEHENEPNIRFNSIDPGAVRTAMRLRLYPGEDMNIHPAPDAIMDTYLYLMGSDSHGHTGQQLNAQ